MLKHLVIQTLLHKKDIHLLYRTNICSSKCVQWTGKSEIYADNSAQNKKINQWCDCDHIIFSPQFSRKKKIGELILGVQPIRSLQT